MQEINKKLVEIYGLTVENKPKFRLVWSDTQFETRVGFHEVFSGDVWLRTDHGPFVASRYGYVQHRWILEMYYESKLPPEILSTDPYEALWTFEEGQIPVWKAVEMIIYSWMNQVHEKKLTQEEAFDKEVAENLIKIQNNSPMIPTLMQHGSAVFLDSTKQEKLNVRSDDSQSGADPD